MRYRNEQSPRTVAVGGLARRHRRLWTDLGRSDVGSAVHVDGGRSPVSLHQLTVSRSYFELSERDSPEVAQRIREPMTLVSMLGSTRQFLVTWETREKVRVVDGGG